MTTTTTPIQAETTNEPGTENKKTEKTNAPATEAQKENENRKKTEAQTEETTRHHQVGDQEITKVPKAEENNNVVNED